VLPAVSSLPHRSAPAIIQLGFRLLSQGGSAGRGEEALEHRSALGRREWPRSHGDAQLVPRVTGAAQAGAPVRAAAREESPILIILAPGGTGGDLV